jgi:hypothetical protein
LALQMARVVVTGACWINDNRAVSHIRIHLVLAGIIDLGFADLSILCISRWSLPALIRSRENGGRQIPLPGKVKA